MDVSPDELARLLRLRRLLLVGVCLLTAGACGVASALLVPEVLVGGEPADEVRRPAPAVQAGREGGPFLLSRRLDLEPWERRSNAQRWAAMSQAQRDACLRQYWSLVELDPGEREAMLEQYARFRRADPDRRKFLRSRARALQDFIADLNPQDQAVLNRMTLEQRARRLRELWEAKHGRW